MSTVSCWGSENLGKKKFAAGSDTDGHSRIETSSSLVLGQQLEVLIYSVPSPHSVLL